jgi:putative restriction endonuclease
MLTDSKVRSAAFDWLKQQVGLHGEVLPREVLQQGFVLEGNRIPLLSPKGIFKPAVLPEIPLSIVTSPRSPYGDGFSPDGLLQYKYRGDDAGHPDNVGLRKAMKHRVPLIYFHGIAPGKYVASWPVYVIGDNPKTLTFTVVVDEVATVRILEGEEPRQTVPDERDLLSRRVYVTQQILKRVHQQAFRIRVLAAYREQCACCRLRHEQLLDAAHIIPDSEPEGEPIVSNGIALCKLHHAAFDGFFIGISPDHVIRVRPDILQEEDGPMLLHGLQGLNGKTIVLPQSKKLFPDPKLLEKRFSLFRAAS